MDKKYKISLIKEKVKNGRWDILAFQTEKGYIGKDHGFMLWSKKWLKEFPESQQMDIMVKHLSDFYKGVAL